MSTRDGKPYNPDRRCHWFDNNGRPYKRLDGGLGCPRNKNCYFVHPTDTEAWRNARYSGEPPLQYLTDDEYRLIVGRHRSPGRPVYIPHHHQQQQQQHQAVRNRSLSADRRHRRPERSLGRRRSASRDREAALAREATLASRIRRRSPSREHERGPFQRSSRSRSPLRTRLRTPPPLGQMGAPRVLRPYGMVPDGPRNGGGTPRSPVVFPKAETTDIPVKDVSVRQGVYMREESIASTRAAPSHQPTPTRPSYSTQATAVTATTTSTPGPSAPTSDAIKTLLESSKLQWQQISSAVAAASSAVPKQNTASGDISVEEKNKIWTSRIELLAAATRIHTDCRSVDNDIQDYKQLVESFSYQTLPVEDRTVIEGHLHTLQSQLAQKTGEMKKILSQLTAAKFWPTHTYRRAPSGEHDNTQLQEFVNQMQALKSSISNVQGMVQSVDTRWARIQSKRASGLGSTDTNSGESRDSLNQASSFLADAIVPSELEKIRDTLATFGEKLATLQGDVVRQNETYLEQVEAIVAESVQVVVLASTGNVQAKPPAPRAALTEEQLRTLQTLQQNAVATGQQVARLSKEVAQMATRNDQLQTENSQLHASNAQLRQQLEEASQSSSHGDSAKIDKMQREMSALNAAVKAYISHGSTQQLPTVPTAEAIVKQITPHMTKYIPDIIAPELQTMRNQLQETLRTQQSEAIKELSSKMSLTLRAVDTIRGMVDKISKAAQAAAPNVASPTPASAQVASIPMNGTS